MELWLGLSHGIVSPSVNCPWASGWGQNQSGEGDADNQTITLWDATSRGWAGTMSQWDNMPQWVVQCYFFSHFFSCFRLHLSPSPSRCVSPLRWGDLVMVSVSFFVVLGFSLAWWQGELSFPSVTVVRRWCEGRGAGKWLSSTFR